MSSPLPQSTVDALVARSKGPPSWWPVTSKEKWQDAVQGLNWSLTLRLRDNILCHAWTPRSLGSYYGLPEWLVMALIGMPTGDWWSMKGERDCPEKVRLP